MRKLKVALPVLFVLLAGSAVGVTAQDEAGADGLVTEEVAPGVARIIRDDAGHDLDAKHPTHRYDMDGITITPDGTIWLATTYSRSDNASDPFSAFVWALGEPGTFSVTSGLLPAPDTTYLYVQPDGTRTVVESRIVSTGDGSFIPDVGWLGPCCDEHRSVVVARSDGDHTCRVPESLSGVICGSPSGEVARYLPHTLINQIAVAPDGAIWAVGGYDGDNGGLYRITLD